MSYEEDPEGSRLKFWTRDFRTSPLPAAWKTERPKVPPGQEWTDPNFDKPAIIKVDTSAHQIEWKRSYEIVEDPVLFAGGADKGDINQGTFGTCWFLSMLTNLAERPKLLKKVIDNDAFKPKTDGIFHCRLWRFGEWVDVYNDDILPVEKGTNELFGAQSKSGTNEMWVSLMEKALAGCHDSYSVAEGGMPSDAYLALTGGVPETVIMEYTNKNTLFKRIVNALKCGAFVTCSSKSGTTPPDGIIPGHAYTLIAAKEVTKKNGKRAFLLRMRNPWGSDEWTGKWSDKSPNWKKLTDEDRNQLLEDKEDGEFWMALRDFKVIFFITTVCSLTPDFDINGEAEQLNYVLRIFGEWKGSSRENQPEAEILKDNPRLAFTVPHEDGFPDPVPVVVHIIQRADRGDETYNLNCHLFKSKSLDDESVVTSIKREKDETHYARMKQRTFRFELTPGRYILVPSTGDREGNREFLARLYSPYPLSDCSQVADNTDIVVEQ
ncbi:calpain-2 catalytic subunit-like [Haliotis cracherodii]|uniref:calpain-2 catalytic subunit-like n=1 Tax=Haliotis cracherodii TaxID=6455 RepID=UPI0039EBF4CB